MASEIQSQKVPLWLDCDPGHDDAFAILLAAHHLNITLLGISTVHGNASVDRTTINAGSFLTAVGKSTVPVYPGAAKPFCRQAVYAPHIHGTSGLEGTTLLPNPISPPITTTNAITAMHDVLLSQPQGTPWLVASGSLTNIALLFTVYPDLVNHIAGLSIMGGAIGDSFTDAPLGHIEGEGPRYGNFTRWAEFNIYCDPEAAASIFSNPVLAAKTTLIPLDITHLVLATPDVLASILRGPRSRNAAKETPPSPLRVLLHDLLSFFAHTYATVFGVTAGPPLHDPIAVAVILDMLGTEPMGFRYNAPASRDENLVEEPGENERGEGEERWVVEVVVEGKHSEDAKERAQMGRTIVRPVEKGQSGVRIPRGLDVERFWTVLGECVDRAEEAAKKDGVFESIVGSDLIKTAT